MAWARLEPPPRSASACIPESECQMNAWDVRKSLLKANPTIVPDWLMPLASAFANPLSVPNSLSSPAALQLTADHRLLVWYHPAETPASLIELACPEKACRGMFSACTV